MVRSGVFYPWKIRPNSCEEPRGAIYYIYPWVIFEELCQSLWYEDYKQQNIILPLSKKVIRVFTSITKKDKFVELYRYARWLSNILIARFDWFSLCLTSISGFPYRNPTITLFSLRSVHSFDCGSPLSAQFWTSSFTLWVLSHPFCELHIKHDPRMILAIEKTFRQLVTTGWNFCNTATNCADGHIVPYSGALHITILKELFSSLPNCPQ